MPVGVIEGVRDGVGVRVGVTEGVGVLVGVLVLVGVTEGVREGVGVLVGVLVLVGVTEGVREGVGVLVGVTDGVRVRVDVTDGVLVLVGVTDGVLVLVGVTDGVRVLVGVMDGVRVPVDVRVGVCVGVRVRVGVWDGVRVPVGVTEGVLVRVGVCDGVPVPVGVLVGVTEGVLVRVDVWEGVLVPVGVTEGVLVRVAVWEGVLVPVGVTEGVLVRVGVWVCVMDGVRVRVGVCDGVRVRVGVCDGVPVPVRVRVGVCVGVRVRVGVADTWSWRAQPSLLHTISDVVRVIGGGPTLPVMPANSNKKSERHRILLVPSRRKGLYPNPISNLNLTDASTQSRRPGYNLTPQRMGIHGLASYLKWKVGGSVRRPVQWSAPAGSRWAVDCACLLYKAESAGLSPLTVIASVIVRIRRAGAEPVFFFDGRSAPTEKSAVQEKRRAARTAARERTAALTEELATSITLTVAERGEREVEIAALRAAAPSVGRSVTGTIKQFLYSAGVLGVTATGEADDVMAWLVRRGEVSAVVTTDYDMLARGVGRMLVPENPDATVWSQIDLTDVLGVLRIGYEPFVRACVAMGCDYSPAGWRGTLPAVALTWARTGENWSGLVRAGETVDEAGLRRAEDMLRGEGVTWESLLDERQREKWAGGVPAKEPDAMEAYFAEYRWPAEWRAWL